MYKFRLLFLPVFISALLLVLVSAGPGPVEIKLKPTAGKLGKYEINLDVDVKTKYDNKEIRFGMNMLMVTDIVALEPSGDTIFTDITYTRLLVRTNNMGTITVVDTDNPEEESNVYYQVYKCMVGRPIRIGFNAHGKVLSVSGIDAIHRAMRDSADSDDPETQEKLVQSIKGVFSEERIRQDMMSSMRFMPPGALVPGGKWKSTISTQTNGMNIRMDDAFVLKGTADNLHTIAMKGKVSTDKRPVVMESGSAVSYLLKGTETATFKVNAGNGWLEEMDMVLLMKGKAITEAGGQKLVLNMEMKSSSSQRRLPD